MSRQNRVFIGFVGSYLNNNNGKQDINTETRQQAMAIIISPPHKSSSFNIIKNNSNGGAGSPTSYNIQCNGGACSKSNGAALR